MKKKLLRAALATAGITVALPFLSAAPAGATEVCADGTVLGQDLPLTCTSCPIGVGPIGHPDLARVWACVNP